MGTWEVDYFENDAAADWLYSLEDNPTKETLSDALQTIINGDNSADATAEAIASIAVISHAFVESEYINDYLEANEVNININELKLIINSDLIIKAKRCFNIILTDSNNELFELWSEEDLLDQWLDSLKDLEAKLSKINI